MPVSNASRNVALSRVKCATKAEIEGWMEMHLKTARQETSRPIMQAFCGDGLAEWCKTEAVAGRCIRSYRKQR